MSIIGNLFSCPNFQISITIPRFKKFACCASDEEMEAAAAAAAVKAEAASAVSPTPCSATTPAIGPSSCPHSHGTLQWQTPQSLHLAPKSIDLYAGDGTSISVSVKAKGAGTPDSNDSMTSYFNVDLSRTRIHLVKTDLTYIGLFSSKALATSPALEEDVVGRSIFQVLGTELSTLYAQIARNTSVSGKPKMYRLNIDGEQWLVQGIPVQDSNKAIIASIVMESAVYRIPSILPPPDDTLDESESDLDALSVHSSPGPRVRTRSSASATALEKTRAKGGKLPVLVEKEPVVDGLALSQSSFVLTDSAGTIMGVDVSGKCSDTGRTCWFGASDMRVGDSIFTLLPSERIGRVYKRLLELVTAGAAPISIDLYLDTPFHERKVTMLLNLIASRDKPDESVGDVVVWAVFLTQETPHANSLSFLDWPRVRDNSACTACAFCSSLKFPSSVARPVRMDELRRHSEKGAQAPGLLLTSAESVRVGSNGRLGSRIGIAWIPPTEWSDEIAAMIPAEKRGISYGCCRLCELEVEIALSGLGKER